MEKENRIYHISRIHGSGSEWRKEASLAAIDQYPWGAQAAVDCRPVTSARLATDGESLFVYMETDETELRAEARGFGFVHTDSCMELFLMPDPQDPRYLNWEFNPAGAMYLSLGTGRHNREKLPRENYHELFQVTTAVHPAGWSLEFIIPLSFVRGFFPSFTGEPGHAMRGNLYKCGDNTAHPHYGCWSPINLPAPDFHCPDFFGRLIF